MSTETPHTAREAKMLRGNAKRKITNLVKDGISLLQSDYGIPCDEYKLLADMIREHLEILQETNDHVIRFKCEELKLDEYESEEDLDKAEQDIAVIEQAHFDEARDNAMPIARDLIRQAKRLLDAESSKLQPQNNRPNPPVYVHAQLPKLKFPTFSGDLRDYKLFKKQFLHYSQHLDEIECFYQLVESMEKIKEKSKIKSCSDTTRAWEILDEFYGDEDQIVETLIGDLERMNSYDTKSHINISAMEKFVESLQNFESQMESLGKSGDLSGRFLVSQVRRKLPEEHRILYLKCVRDEGLKDTLSGLVRWLHSQLVLLKKAKGSTDLPDNSKPSYSYKPQKTHINKSANVSTMSPGATATYNRNNHFKKENTVAQDSTEHQAKCPLHPQNNNHYLKGCNRFRTLSQKEKFEVMKTYGICHRCGHNNCISGKPPYDNKQCQFIQPCQIPTCRVDTHFSSICPRVYGNEGYNHFDKNQSSSNAETYEQTYQKKSNSLTLAPMISNIGNVVSTTLNDVNKTSDDTLRPVCRMSCVLPTVMAYLRIGSTKIPVRTLLDCGSQLSLVRKGLMKFNGPTQEFRITTVGGETMTHRLRVEDCEIESLDGTFTRKVRLTEMEKPCGEIPIVTNEQIRQYPHMNNIEIEEASNEVIDMLLGVENGDLLTSEQYIIGPNEEDPIAAKCPLGWYIQGGRYNETPINNIMNFTQVSAISEIEDFLGIERMGIEPRRCKCSIEAEEKSATEQMQNSVTRLEDGVYQINLPWKKSPLELPNNYDYAVKRLINLEKQFQNRPHEWEIYCQQMDDQLTRGVAREVSQEEMDTDTANGTKMCFLPHFGVNKDSETTPLRVVYDGKARYQGHSLNDYLAKGHNMNVDLFDIALRFREYEVGVIADISKMFQAVKMAPEDARFHRYLFRKHSGDPIKVYELTTVTFGDKPSPAAAIIALRHVAAENAPNDPEIQRIANNQFYVDDLTDSQRSTDKAQKLKSNLTSTLQKGNFKIRKWLSNEPTLCDVEFYPVNDVTSVLGTRWNLKTDTLSVKESTFKDFIPTKRNILKMTASYFDVYGMLSGILVRPKILLQQLWQYDINWDDPINPDSDLHMMLNKIKQDLEDVDSIEIKRCLIPEKFQGQSELPTISLHGFSDASEDAMGIGVWMRWSNEDESDAQLTFVCAKARLTPLKQSSIPRKELQAILLLSRLMIVIMNALRLKIEYVKMWTDSITTISWLRGQSKSFKSYVAYRVGEITSDFDPYKDVSYVPTEQNIIDLVSRGMKASEMKKIIEGPDFLKKTERYWAKTPSYIPVNMEDIELKKFHVRNAKVLAVRIEDMVPIIDSKRFSSWTKLVMVTARILSLKDIPKKKWLKDLTSTIALWPTYKKIKEAELYWIRYSQKDLNFEDHNIMKLEPIYDETEKVYRVGGRINKAQLSYDIRHPYLLPKKHHVSLLIARERHRHCLHGGHLRTAAEIRKQFWIIGDINLSLQVVRECIVCIRYRGKPMEQRMADLPDFRIKPCSPPFQTTLVDYLGPVNVKLNRNTVTKGYCAVFTCAVTRAVHLTCVQDLSTSAFLQALERFVSIRGAPELLISDNATCFRGADNEIRDLQLRLDQDQVRSNCVKFKITWKFGPPAGPHHQGAVERIVQEVKKSMKHMVSADKLHFVEWETIFCQISGLLNSRPLTAYSSSPLDEPPITPNHFLIGRGDLKSPQIPCDDYAGNVRKRRELCNNIVTGFWRRWMINIHKLSPRQKWSKCRENLAKRDIVLVIDEKSKRGKWKLAEVIETYIGDDNLVRIVDVKLPDGSTLKRPVTKLILLMKHSERQD